MRDMVRIREAAEGIVMGVWLLGASSKLLEEKAVLKAISKKAGVDFK